MDDPVDITRDYVSPKGFFHSTEARRLMPAGGVRFLDNAWYFGADGLGVVVVKTPEGLLLFDTMSTPEEFQKAILSEMPAAGLDPKDIRYVFVGHYHWDHTGGVNLIRKIAPRAKVVISEPDARIVDQSRAALLAGNKSPYPSALVSPRAQPKTPEEAKELHATRLLSIPQKFDILVHPEPGLKTGTMMIRTGAKTEVAAILDPGHTPGQMSVVVPVLHQGTMRKLLVMSGNDNPEEAMQYAISMDYLRSVAAQLGADTVINTHPYQSAMFYHLRQLKANPASPNPFAMGPDGVDRFLGIFGQCQRAVANRLKDGTWLAF
ncbi:MBL fold metallo-hydrolase [Sphingobium sp. SCG-1]|uniref:MBL fold metallo-hydrolase n=1 Tax=Sphingobium sp. SCG-1 TaxID=2072936 RepID=UPI00166F9C33|nr:MBL fold metallo-hydrolase [Sphingobium sp. SCG-1]